MDYIAFLHELADAADQATMAYFRNTNPVDNKLDAGFDPVTKADREAEKRIRALIEEHFPDHGIIGEEFENKNETADDVWILDPIDGTRAFISGLPVWGTLIGLKRNGKATMGMMSQGFTKERYVSDGKTSHLAHAGHQTILETRPCSTLADATLFTTSPDLFTDREMARYQAVENQVQLARYGADCYAYCMLASGHTDLVIESGLNTYDIAALIPIVEGAGGVITTWSGDNPVDGGSIVAAGDPALHDIVLKELNA